MSFLRPWNKRVDVDFGNGIVLKLDVPRWRVRHLENYLSARPRIHKQGEGPPGLDTIIAEVISMCYGLGGLVAGSRMDKVDHSYRLWVADAYSNNPNRLDGVDELLRQSYESTPRYFVGRSRAE